VKKIKIKKKNANFKSIRKASSSSGGTIENTSRIYTIPSDRLPLQSKSGGKSKPIVQYSNKKKIYRYGVNKFNKKFLSDPEPAGLSIVIATMIWRRHDVFMAWAAGIRRLKNRFPKITINVVVVGSEGRLSRELVEGCGFKYVESPNAPLGRKANIRLLACKEYDPDYVILTGSDNLFSDKYFLFVLLNMQKKKYDEIASLDIYYYDLLTKYSTYSNGYQGNIKGIGHHRGEPIAPGRALSKEILEKLEWKLWLDSEDKYLDKWPRDAIKKHRKRHLHFSCRENGLVMCDIKGEVNMTKSIIRVNHEVVSDGYIRQEIPEIFELEKIRKSNGS
jgi:hypothetical protein